MPVSDKESIPSSSSSSLELDPLLRDLVEKKLNLKRNVMSMAAELKDARRKLASQELLVAQELEARKVAELKARNLEEEVRKLQKCLEEKDEQLRASQCSTEQYHNELDGIRSLLVVTQATAESTAVSAKSALQHCSSLLPKLIDKDNVLKESQFTENNVAEQLNHLHVYLKSNDPSQGQLKGYSLRTKSAIMDAFIKAEFHNTNDLLETLSDISAKNNNENNNEDLIYEDDGIDKLRECVRLLSSLWENKSKELESQLAKHRRRVQELKKRVLKLEICLLEPRSWLWKLHRIRKKKGKSLTLKELRNQVAVVQTSGSGSGDKHNLWESSGFKLILSMSILALVKLVKR